MKIIGITGPSGAGKTTVLEHLEKLGARVIQADKVYHELLDTDRDLIKQLFDHFPSVFPDGKPLSGSLDRKALARLVFAETNAKLELEAITHPLVIARMSEMVGHLESIGEEFVVIEAIALVESGFAKMCETVVAVLARPDVMTTRITARDDISLHAAAERLSAQPDDEFYMSHATHVLVNNDDIESLLEQTDKLLDEIIPEIFDRKD